MSGRTLTEGEEGEAFAAVPGDWRSIFYFPEKRLGFHYSFRWIPEKPDHGKIFMNLAYQFTDWLRAGVDYRPLVDEVWPQANLRVIPEDPDSWRPAVIVGTSNDDYGDINSQAYYATLSKFLFKVGGVGVSPYVGAVYIYELEEVRPLAGLHLRHGSFSTMFQYSGIDEHLSFSYSLGNHTLGFLLFDLDLPGLYYNFKF